MKKGHVTTIRGNRAAGGWASNTDGAAWESISFGFYLASAPVTHYFVSGQTPPRGCGEDAAGGADASPGHFCVSQCDSLNSGGATVFTSTPDNWGQAAQAHPQAEAGCRRRLLRLGTWAVTAPAVTSP